MDDHIDPGGAAVSERIVVVTGVPGAGKSTLARRLAPRLGLPLLSLDAIKESLSDAMGETLPDPARLRFAAEAVIAAVLDGSPSGAVLDIWLDPSRGDRERLRTWLPATALRCEVFCRVPAEVAVRRYADRVRHPMHRGGEEVLRRIADSVRILDDRGSQEVDGLGAVIRVDTTIEPDLPCLLAAISGALGHAGAER